MCPGEHWNIFINSAQVIPAVYCSVRQAAVMCIVTLQHLAMVGREVGDWLGMVDCRKFGVYSTLTKYCSAYSGGDFKHCR